MELDYGTSHMGDGIYFAYQGNTLSAMETIGKRIQNRRKELGITRQSDLGELVGLHQSTISDIENGQGFGHEYVMPIARALKWSAEQLLEGKSGASMPLSEEMRALLDECQALNDEDMAALIRAAQGMRHAPKAGPGSKSARRRA